MSFEVKNLSTAKNPLPLAIRVGKQLIDIGPGKVRTLGADLAAGVLRILSAAKHISIKPLTEEAEASLAAAVGRVKTKTLAVHGPGDRSAAEARAAERAAKVRPVVRDLKTPAGAPPLPPIAQPAGGGDGPQVEGAAAQQPAPPAAGPTEPPDTPAGHLLRDVRKGEIALRDARRRAKEILGDAYPAGASIDLNQIEAAIEQHIINATDKVADALNPR